MSGPTTGRSDARLLAVVGVALLVGLVLQTSVLSHLAWQGVVPHVVLLVVVGTALVHGAETGLVVGFAAGLLVDLAPPADHVAGRWALALLVVGYVVGRVRQPGRASPVAVLVTVAAASFVGSSLFALTGVVLGDPDLGTGVLLQGIALALVVDVLLAPFVLPPMLAVLRHLEPETVPVGRPV